MSQITFNKKNVSEMQSNQAYSEVLDFNNDGYFDIVYCDMAKNKVKILLNNKAEGFVLLKEVPAMITEWFYTNILIGDFDNDLFTDFMITFRNGNGEDFVKVYKNVTGSDFELFFNENITYFPIKEFETGAVFWDIDNDNDLDIITRNRVYNYSNGAYTWASMSSWPNIIFSNSQFRNPLSYGNLTVKDNNSVYEANNSMWKYTLNLALDTLWDWRWTKDKQLYDATSKSSIFIELGGNDLTDRIWLSLDDDYYSFKYSTKWNQSPAVKLCDVEKKDSLALFRWDVADINGDKILDLVYTKSNGFGSNEVWVAELKKDEDGILTADKHYKVFMTSSKYSSLKLVDIDNDNDIDIVNSMDVYLNQSNLINTDTNGRIIELGSEFKAELGKYRLSWTDTTSDKKQLLRYDVLTSPNKSELLKKIEVNNQFRAARLPIMATDALSNSCCKGVQAGGWYYWTVRSINSSLRGSEWAELDSFYVEKNVIQGSLKPCINNSNMYFLKHEIEGATHTEWIVIGKNVSIFNSHNYLELKFLESGTYRIGALVYRNNTFLDSIGITIDVRAYPKIELDAPEFACAGSRVILKNIADNGTDSINYIWQFYTNPGIIKRGIGLDSIDITMPEDRALRVVLSSVEDDNYCAFEGFIDNHGRHTIENANNDVKSNFSALEVVCGNQDAKVELDEALGNEATYHWDLDGAEIVRREADSILFINWEVGVNKEISLFVEEYGCISDTTKMVIERKAFPELAFDFDEYNCHGQNIPLSFSGSANAGSTFNWDFEDAELISGAGEGPYNLKWQTGGLKEISLSVNDAGCVSDSTFRLEVSAIPETPEICGLSVNAGNEVVVYWQMPKSDNVDSVYVYKESVQANKYERLAAYGKNDASSLVDTTSDCSSQAYRYRLSVMDSCGFETEMGAYHKSLHLMLNKGQGGSWNLIWSAYEGLDVGTYSIYRGTDKNNMMKIADISGNVYSFTDKYPPLGDLYYTIVISNTQTCNSTLKSLNMDGFIIQSNVVETSIFNALSDVLFNRLYTIGTQNQTLHIFTNEVEKYNLELIDVLGKSIYNKKGIIGNFSEEIQSVSSGIYLVKIEIGSVIKTIKISFK